MSDDSFNDPVTLAAANAQSGGGALQTFFTIMLGLPLAAYGAYTAMTQLLKEDDTPRPRRRAPRPRRVAVLQPEAEESDVLPPDGDTDELSAGPASVTPTAQGLPPGTIPVGTTCIYGTATDELEHVTVTAVHTEQDPPYYTVRFEDGTERQTIRTKLLAPGDPIADEDEQEEGGDDELAEPVKPPVHPEIAYAQSIELSEHRPLVEPSAQSAFVIEATPAGLIAMGYDFAEKRWIYWANSTPHFRVLDTVARVYANTHNRHSLYIPPSVADAANEAAKDGEGAEPSAEKIAQDSKASLFITPTPAGAAELPRPEQKHIANSFKRQGMLSELRFLEDGPRDAPKQLSYEEFLAKEEAVVV
jgi:hypothetical protein